MANATTVGIAARVRLRVRHRLVLPVRDWVSRAVLSRKNASRALRPVFVCGAMGSGTSLITHLLGQTFECAAVINESARDIDTGSPLWVDRTENYASVQRYREFIEPADLGPEFLREELLRFYRSVADGRGDVVIDKGPNTNLLRAPRLCESFPDGRFVLIFRDPVANIEGLRRKWTNFENDPLSASIDFYRDIHERFLDWADRVGPDLTVVEYERLVEDPDRVLENLAARLGLERATRLRALEDRADKPGRGLRAVFGSRVRVVSSATEKSYEAMDESEIVAIREQLGDLHERMRKAAGPTHDRAER